MSAAPLLAVVPDPVVKEPTNLAEAYRQARVDLGARSPDALLRWTFWLARAVGRAELARGDAKRVESEAWEAEMRSRSEWALGNVEAAQLSAVAHKPTDTHWDHTREALVSAVAMVEAMRAVAALLGAKS